MMRRLFLIVFVMLALSAVTQTASAQFYKPVVTLRGLITDKAGKTVAARVSVRDAADTTQEIVSSTANASTGRYLAIVKPAHSYLVRVTGDSLVAQSVAVTTPNADHNTEVVQDFKMLRIEAEHKPAKPTKAVKAPKAKKPTKKPAKKKRK